MSVNMKRSFYITQRDNSEMASDTIQKANIQHFLCSLVQTLECYMKVHFMV